MALNSFFNALSGGFMGASIAVLMLPGAVDSFKKGFNQAQAEQRMKPWSSTEPRTDAPGTYTLYSYGDGAVAFGVFRNPEGKMDRDNGPSLKIFTNKYQTIIAEGWYKNGLLHREDGPALVQYDAVTGKATCEEWYLNGKPTEAWQRASTATECRVSLGPAPTYQPL